MLVLRWFLDATRVAQLAADNQLSSSTTYRYLHEGIDVLAAASPGLHGALLAARTAGHTHVHLDGTSKAPGPNPRIDLWWSGKHHHGGNIQVVTAPDGSPLWTSQVRPGREHDTTCARAHDGLLDAIDRWTDHTHVALADLGYEGENSRLTRPFKTPAGGGLPVDHRAYNAPDDSAPDPPTLPHIAKNATPSDSRPCRNGM